ncbi:MAG: C40 family peptidase [Nanoarchaeota archaeon]|nr:C40 family peptidase [Nanoarchaeota archaeon]MBU1005252.1 C40 family peptidase [Nanoarchaeota archaeon]MBU1945536.1 C40 family peptidase [Nanoarchaeota archaeon]
MTNDGPEAANITIEDIVKEPISLSFGENSLYITQGSNVRRKYENIGPKARKVITFAVDETLKHYSKPFMWGGVSPLTLEEQPNDPFYPSYTRYPAQPKGSWREGLPMEPGFDCIGFLRWIYGNNGSNMFNDKKKTANEYMQLMEAVPSDYNLDNILKEAKPGDILFKCDPETGKAIHGMMYLGNGLMIESAGAKEPDHKNIPETEWSRWRELAHGKINSENQPVSDVDRGGIQINHISKYSHYKIAIATPDILKG